MDATSWTRSQEPLLVDEGADPKSVARRRPVLASVIGLPREPMERQGNVDSHSLPLVLFTLQPACAGTGETVRLDVALPFHGSLGKPMTDASTGRRRVAHRGFAYLVSGGDRASTRASKDSTKRASTHIPPRP